MKRLLACLLILLLPTLGSARMVDVERTTEGHGATYQDAIHQALLVAIQQVRGAQVGTARFTTLFFQQQGSLLQQATSVQVGTEQQIHAESEGWVRSYRVLSSRKPQGSQGQWHVKLAVTVPQFESFRPPTDIRSTIAVMPFRIAQRSYQLDQETVSGVEASLRIQENLQARLTQSQRFAVVNRDYGQEFQSEVALLRSDLVSPTEASRLGNVAGADYMVVGRLHHLGYPPRARQEFYGARLNQNRIRVEASYQVIEVATQQVRWSGQVKQDVPLHYDREISEIYEQVADTLTRELLNALYPVRILDVVSDQQIYLTQGSSTVRQGERLNVHSQGRALDDPETGVAVAVDGPVVAQVEVIEVQPQYSIARLVSGQSSAFAARSVLRPVKAEAQSQGVVRETPGSQEAPLQW